MSTREEAPLVLTDDELACFYITKYVLETHKRLNQEDIGYFSNFIASFYSDSMNTNGKFNEDQLIMMLVYMNQHSICKFAITFNERLDISIKSRDFVSLKNLLLSPKEVFVELYDNPYLSQDSVNFTIRILAREMVAMNNLFAMLKQKVIELEENTCSVESTITEARSVDNKVNITQLLLKCYEEICIQDYQLMNKDIISGIFSMYEVPSQEISTVEPAESKKYCFDLFELLESLVSQSENGPINPKTKKPFSKDALKLINQRLHKEIAMYKRYKEIKAQSS